jgi:murein DD-endopeptidase MepM/ murein hydrolase activator NlpD
MIAVLQRQHVHRRASPPFRLRTAKTGVLWRAAQEAARREIYPEVSRRTPRDIKPTRGRLERPSRLRREAPRRGAPRREAPRREAPRVALRGFTKALARARGAIVRYVLIAAGSPWLAAALLLVVLTLVFFPTLKSAGISLSRAKISLPESSALDQELYRLVIPEELSPPAAKANPVLLNSLKVQSYKTREGDTISQIAEKFRLNLDTVISYNDIRDARSITVGTTLTVPNTNGLKYRVRRGDTLDRIASSFGIALNLILDWNRLDSSLITVGQEIFLPGARMTQNDLSRILGNLFIFPVQGKVSSLFGDRHDPFTGVIRPHNGIDIVNKTGTAIQAAMAGTVYEVGFNRNYGRYIIIRHSGYQTMYAHLDKIVVSPRETVRQGQKVGELGNTGYSTGPHLHFSIFRNGEAVDPLRFLK